MKEVRSIVIGSPPDARASLAAWAAMCRRHHSSAGPAGTSIVAQMMKSALGISSPASSQISSTGISAFIARTRRHCRQSRRRQSGPDGQPTAVARPAARRRRRCGCRRRLCQLRCPAWPRTASIDVRRAPISARCVATDRRRSCKVQCGRPSRSANSAWHLAQDVNPRAPNTYGPVAAWAPQHRHGLSRQRQRVQSGILGALGRDGPDGPVQIDLGPLRAADLAHGGIPSEGSVER